MSELFEINVSAISKHLKNIFEIGELDEKVVVSILEHTTFKIKTIFPILIAKLKNY
ncbi:hypothetical protein KKC83_05990 [Patescibacteria group bacterium]|nr:hypothetical protein [Patescibacteria group bacterium]MBU4015635.1 hypothetical protein [Patescibacteria group bacterium]MBU4027065.1 hypothetical protein [Patescibacteria group bacterium]MBU4072765.1 hypothetical protein [Patescibacteria group bacterium]MBU4102381.1 hypothetical protein [Patescibacteria group bacterium]